MLRRILVPLAGQTGDGAALGAAFAVAKAFEAHVEGLFVHMDPRDAVPLLGEGMSAALAGEIMQAAEHESAAACRLASAAFDVARGAAGAPLVDRPPGPGGVSAAWCEETGQAEDVVRNRARLSDLVVMSQQEANGNAPLLAILESVLLGSARPLLLAPASPPAAIGRVAAVAWNGGAEAARAVSAAMPFLRAAEVVHVLTMETSSTPAEAGEKLAEYLAWHGIAARVSRIRPAGGPVGAGLLAKAAELEVDLLAMGGYGHSRLREMILGGVTRYVLGHAALPVLMAH
jgi:nucleotide-binding universal stress UspA family protein